MPKISILIPIYKSEKYIGECIESALNQTISDIEIICIYDCGNDNTMRIVEEYAKHDSRIKLLYNEHNSGQYISLMYGLKYASGEYIYCLDNDDYIDVNYLKEMSDILDNNKSIAYVFNPNIKRFYVDDNNKVIYKKAKKFSSLKFLYKKYIVCPCDNKTLLTVSTDFTPKLYRKSVLLESETCGFNNNINFNDRILFTYCKSIAIVNSKYSYYYRQLNTSLSHNIENKKNYIEFAKSYVKIFDFYKENGFFSKLNIDFRAIAYFMERSVNADEYFSIIKNTIREKEIFDELKKNIKLYKARNLIALNCFLECNSYNEFIERYEDYFKTKLEKRRIQQTIFKCITIIFIIMILLIYLYNNKFFLF